MTITPTPISAQDAILLIADGAHGRYPLDPIRVMKGCFLVSQRGQPEWRALFNFRPYAYGPFDRRVYTARDALLSVGMLEEDRSVRHGAYSLTDEGEARVAELREALGDDHVDWFNTVGAYVTSRSFSDLLDEVYSEYPEYATRSRYAQS